MCDACGTPLPGAADGFRLECDDCMGRPRPWALGRAALQYESGARKLVLALKHGDRQDIARPAAIWMARVGAPLLRPDMLVAPVPLHWSRLLRRRYNQAALLSAALAVNVARAHCPDLLIRHRRTVALDRKSPDQRFAELSDSISVHPRRRHRLAGRPILLVDDVMTSGATFSACAQACLAAGSGDVFVLALARVAKEY